MSQTPRASPKPDPKTTTQPNSLDAKYKKWDKMSWADASEGEEDAPQPKKAKKRHVTAPIDPKKLNPKDVSVHFGKPLTEEEFNEYRKTKKAQIVGQFQAQK